MEVKNGTALDWQIGRKSPPVQYQYNEMGVTSETGFSHQCAHGPSQTNPNPNPNLTLTQTYPKPGQVQIGMGTYCHRDI